MYVHVCTLCVYVFFGGVDIGVDLAGLLGGRMASAKGGSVPSGVGYGELCPLSSRLKGLGERRELPQRGKGQSPGQKRILACFEGHRTLIFVPICQNLGGTLCASVPRSKFWGDLSSPCSFVAVDVNDSCI